MTMVGIDAHKNWHTLARLPVVINTRSDSTCPDPWEPVRRPERLVECDNYDEWIALIAADKGVGATSLSASVTHAHIDIAFIPLDGAPAVLLNLAWRHGGAGALVRRFVELAAERRPAIGS